MTTERDELRSSKDDLLQKISKVDRDIAVADSQIAKLRNKKQELEEAAKRPVSDAKAEEEERPLSKSVSQQIYQENRVRVRFPGFRKNLFGFFFRRFDFRKNGRIICACWMTKLISFVQRPNKTFERLFVHF